MDGGTRTAVWLRPEQTDLARAVSERLGLTLVGAGSPDRALAGAAASDLGTDSIEDLRALLASTDADLVWMLDPGSFGGSAEDVAALADARQRGVRVATLEPVPASAIELSGAWDDRGLRPADAMRFIPRTRETEGVCMFLDARESFGSTRIMTIECTNSAGTPSLGGLLLDAVDLVRTLVGEPELVDASYAGPRANGGLHAQPGDTLRGLRGDLTAHLRFPDGRSASLLLSDRAGIWNRSVTLIGENGRVRLDDQSFAWRDTSGELVDSHEPAAQRKDTDAHQLTASVRTISEQLGHLLNQTSATAAPVDHASALAVAQAALLSARTGQSESPATIRRLVGPA